MPITLKTAAQIKVKFARPDSRPIIIIAGTKRQAELKKLWQRIIAEGAATLGETVQIPTSKFQTMIEAIGAPVVVPPISVVRRQ